MDEVLDVGTLTYLTSSKALFLVIEKGKSVQVATGRRVPCDSLVAKEILVAPYPFGGKQDA